MFACSAVGQLDWEVDRTRDGTYSCENEGILVLSADGQGEVSERRSGRMEEMDLSPVGERMSDERTKARSVG